MQVPALTKTNRENTNVKCNITDILLKITLITNKPIYKFIGCTATADFQIVLKMQIFLNSNYPLWYFQIFEVKQYINSDTFY
jgi:hypothetical protein